MRRNTRGASIAYARRRCINNARRLVVEIEGADNPVERRGGCLGAQLELLGEGLVLAVDARVGVRLPGDRIARRSSEGERLELVGGLVAAQAGEVRETRVLLEF